MRLGVCSGSKARGSVIMGGIDFLSVTVDTSWFSHVAVALLAYGVVVSGAYIAVWGVLSVLAMVEDEQTEGVLRSQRIARARDRDGYEEARGARISRAWSSTGSRMHARESPQSRDSGFRDSDIPY